MAGRTVEHRMGMSSPRVLLVLTEFPPSIGGMQTHALYLSRYLADQGYDVRVVTYRPSSNEERDAARCFDETLSFPVYRSLSRLAFWFNVELLGRFAGQFQADLIYCSTVFYGFLRDMVRVPVICRSAGNDVLRPWIAYPFRLACRALATPRLDDWIYNTFRRMEYPEFAEMIFRERRQELVRRSARQMDLILANSKFTADLLGELGVEEDRIRILVGGVDAQRFGPRDSRGSMQLRRALGIDDDAYVITTVCRQVAKKGVDFLLRAFRTVHSLMPDTHLLVVGDGHRRKHYERMALELDLAAHVTFAGSVNHLEIQRYYWLSDLFVLASRVQVNPTTGVRDAETMGRVLCEANAAAVPVVAARSGGIPSVVTHERNGLLFEPDNEGDLIEQIRRLRMDRDLEAALVENGLRMAKEFDWSTILANHEVCFAEVLRENSGSRAEAQPRESLRGTDKGH